MNDMVMLMERLGVIADADDGRLGRKAEKRARRVLARSRKIVARSCREAGDKAFGHQALPGDVVSANGAEWYGDSMDCRSRR